jgi:hypothetical protein
VALRRVPTAHKPTCFLLPLSVLNFLHSARLTGASVAEKPLDAEYDGKSVDTQVTN